MKKLFSILIVGGLVLAACNTATPTPDTSNVPVVTDDFAVTAEGRLLPGQYAQISFSAGGKVAELLKAEGDTVADGDVIARLENSEALQAEVARAETEALNAQQALDDLNETADVAAAQAQLAVANAQDALDTAQRHLNGLNNPDLKWYRDQLKDKQDLLLTAQENVEVTDIGSLRASLQAARDGLKLMDERLGKIKAAIDGCSTCDPKRSVTVDGFPQTLEDAQDARNDAANAVRELEIKVTQAERGNQTAIDDAQKAVDDAQDDLDWALGDPNSIDLAVAQAKVEVAKADLAEAQTNYDKMKGGPDPDKLASAQARLASAQAGLTAAKAALDNIELRAPFGGTLAGLELKVGEQVAPGAPVATIADFSKWIVETDNLTEIEVVRVEAGQNATITLDALPDVTLHGVVEKVASVFEEKRGDITYTVTIALSDGDPLMRWGMTAVATFEK